MASSSDKAGAITPIDPSTANKYLGHEEIPYPRYYNIQNQRVVVEKLAKLEGAEDGLILSSGMAAISSSLFALLQSGDHVLLTSELYGGTHKLVVDQFPRYGISYDFVSGADLAQLKSKMKNETKVIYFETPSNPLLTVVDIRGIVALAKERGIKTVIDNTFGTPICQNPITMGVDVVVHSGTKYLGGHSDLCFGAVLTTKELKEKILKTCLSLGGSLNGLDCYLIERSLKTLALRVERQCVNAQHLAEFLVRNEKITHVFYPGLKTHLGHDIAREQMQLFGGMLAFEIRNEQKVEEFLSKLRHIQPMVSLGGVETTICQPTQTSHQKMPKEDRLRIGVTDRLLRVSVGIENVEDLMEDLEQALR